MAALSGKTLEDLNASDLDTLWEEAKISADS